MFTRYELTDNALIWCDDTGTVVYRRSRSGLWYYNELLFSFDVWLELVNLPNEEKIMLKLQYG